MPVDYYPNKTVEELQAILNSLQNRQRMGAVTEFTAAGVRTVRTAESTAAPVETQLLRVLYSLYLRAAGTEFADQYPNPYAQRIRKTRPHYL